MAFHSRSHARRGVGSGVELELGAAAIVFAVVGGLVIAGNVGWLPSLAGAGAPPLGGTGASSPSNPLGGNGNGSTPGGPNATTGPGSGTTGGNVTVTPNGSSPGGPNGSSNGSGGPQWPLSGTAGTFVPGPTVASVNPGFFQIDIQTPNLTSPWLWNLLNETPFTYYSFGDAAETTNQVTDTAYASNGTVLAPSKSNDTNFIAFCREIHCHSIMALPAEINNTTLDAQTVSYIENTLGFHPDYWGIGNEPQGWTHFNIPWTRWQTTDDSNTTPLAYAQEVQRIVHAVHAVDPTAKLIGIQSADGGSYNNSEWLDEVAAIDGPNLTAVAIHPYPDGSGPTDPTNASFYAPLSSSIKFPNNYQGLSESVDAACGCALPIWVGEYNSALNGTYAPYEDGYPEVPYMAAGLAGAMKDGIPHVAFFALQHPPAMLIGASGAPYPVFSLFATFLKNMTYGTVLASSVATSLGGVYAVMIENGSSATLLVVNTNTTAALNLSVPTGLLSGIPLGWQAWRWAPEFPAPIATDGADAPPTGWVVPAQGLWMLNLST